MICQGIEIEPNVFSGCEPIKCFVCRGTGRVNWWNAECGRCFGTGQMLDCPECRPNEIGAILRSSRYYEPGAERTRKPLKEPTDG